MNTQKIAITLPSNIIPIVDSISKQKGISRSKYIATVLQEKIKKEQNLLLKEAYNRVFNDEQIKKEQLETSIFFEGSELDEGQEW